MANAEVALWESVVKELKALPALGQEQQPVAIIQVMLKLDKHARKDRLSQDTWKRLIKKQQVCTSGAESSCATNSVSCM